MFKAKGTILFQAQRRSTQTADTKLLSSHIGERFIDKQGGINKLSPVESYSEDVQKTLLCFLINRKLYLKGGIHDRCTVICL